MDGKGFTLIELLAVIVIMALIALIATPQVMKLINDTRINADKENINSFTREVIANVLIDKEYKREINLNYSNNNNNDVIPAIRGFVGSASINDDNKLKYNFYKNNMCYIKRYDSNNIETIKLLPTDDFSKCGENTSKNLIKNGNLEYGNNTNFIGSEYVADYNGKPALVMRSSRKLEVISTEYIKINPNKKYKFSVESTINNENARLYLGTIALDKNEEYIQPMYVASHNNTIARLTKDVNIGDTAIYLDNTNRFVLHAYPNVRGFVIWNYNDNGPLTYSKNVYHDMFNNTPAQNPIDYVNNTITLNKGFPVFLPKGTAISQSTSNGYDYNIYSYTSPLLQARNSAEITGYTNGRLDFSKFRYGTEYIKIVISVNTNNIPNTEYAINKITFEEIE